MASFLFETYLMVGQGMLDLLEMDMHHFNENLPDEAYFTQGRGHWAVLRLKKHLIAKSYLAKSEGRALIISNLV